MGAHGDSGLFKPIRSGSRMKFAPLVPSRPGAGHPSAWKSEHRREKGSPAHFVLIQRWGWTPDVHGCLSLKIRKYSSALKWNGAKTFILKWIWWYYKVNACLLTIKSGLTHAVSSRLLQVSPINKKQEKISTCLHQRHCQTQTCWEASWKHH